MGRKVREFIQIRNHTSLDALIEQLIEIRDSLPADSEAQVKMKGDDVFGRQLSVSFLRPQTAEEAECDARYADAYRASREQRFDDAQPARPHRLRSVA